MTLKKKVETFFSRSFPRNVIKSSLRLKINILLYIFFLISCKENSGGDKDDSKRQKRRLLDFIVIVQALIIKLLVFASFTKFLLETNKPLTVVENYIQSLSIMSRMRTKGKAFLPPPPPLPNPLLPRIDIYCYRPKGKFCYYGAKMKNIGFPFNFHTHIQRKTRPSYYLLCHVTLVIC